MAVTKYEHFHKAATDISLHGDNDTLPFDVDTRFVKENDAALSKLAFDVSQRFERQGRKATEALVKSLPVFSERLLVPTGPTGFRTTTKIHPFWNLYLNGLAVAVAELNEPKRNNRAHAYRYSSDGNGLFDRVSSWRVFREASIADCRELGDEAVVVQTDISSFYEHVYHHRLKNVLDDLLPPESTVPIQLDLFLAKLAAGRSFGLPVGGQCARVLAELFLTSIDNMLTDAGVTWRRYVDDFVLVTQDQESAYRALAELSNALADYGLTLNKTKTTLLSAPHYIDYVLGQLHPGSESTARLQEIDLHFDPYSDTALEDYVELKQLVRDIDVRLLLELELQKGQPDSFVVAQIGRAIRLQSADVALQLCRTLLGPGNLHAFRASWATIMRGVVSVCGNVEFADIHEGLDDLLDEVPKHSSHLLQAEGSLLHYLRTIRFRRTQVRAEFVLQIYEASKSQAVRRACIDCWRQWRDRPRFTQLRNKWGSLSPEEQRMLWVAAAEFGDEGDHFRRQIKHSLVNEWRLGIEQNGQQTFAEIYSAWEARLDA